MTGNFAGIAVYQDRRASANTVKINGGSSNVIQGAVYFPNATLQINGSGEATSLCAMWVADKLRSWATATSRSAAQMMWAAQARSRQAPRCTW